MPEIKPCFVRLQKTDLINVTTANGKVAAKRRKKLIAECSNNCTLYTRTLRGEKLQPNNEDGEEGKKNCEEEKQLKEDFFARYFLTV